MARCNQYVDSRLKLVGCKHTHPSLVLLASALSQDTDTSYYPNCLLLNIQLSNDEAAVELSLRPTTVRAKFASVIVENANAYIMLKICNLQLLVVPRH